jgi:hypothetical protein
MSWLVVTNFALTVKAYKGNHIFDQINKIISILDEQLKVYNMLGFLSIISV